MALQGGSTAEALEACGVWQLWESAAEIMEVARKKEKAGALPPLETGHPCALQQTGWSDGFG